MHLVFDSNIIRSAEFGGSNLYRLLLHLAGLLGYSINVSEIVIDEVTSQIAEELERTKPDADTEARQWGRTLVRSLESSLDGIDPKEEADLFRKKLEAYDSVLPYPEVSHRALTMRAIHRRKPFDKKGSGYRDSLIWESIVTFAATVDGQVILLSEDGDFSDGKGILAKELQSDLVERGLEETKVVLVPSIRQFINSYIRPQFKVILESDPAEGLIKFFDMDPDEGIALWVQDECSGKDWAGEELGLPWEYETLLLSMVEGVSNVKWLTASEVSDGEYLLRIAADLNCEFDAFVPKAYAYGLAGFSISDFEWDSYYAEGSTTVALRCELDLHVKFTDAKDLDISLLSMELSADQ